MLRQALKRSLQLTGAVAAGSTAAAYATYRYERSHVPADSELVRAAVPAPSPPPTLKRLSTDNLMGGFDAYYLAATWYYDGPLDAAAIKATLAEAVTHMPALAGRRTDEGIVLSNAGARFSAREGHPGSARDWVGLGAHDEPPRGDFADVPTCCAGGEQPLFTVRVTNFGDGTSALGIAAPHSLMDGQAYFQVVAALAAAHAEGGKFDAAQQKALPDFDAASCWEASCAGALDARARNEPTLWLPFRLLESTTPLWALGMPRIDVLLPRAKVHLSAAELAALKHDMQKELGGKAECTTNEALSTVLLHALAGAPESHSPFEPGKAGTVRMVVNARGKGRFQGAAEGVAGNFSWMVDDKTPKPPREMHIAEVARFVRALGDKWRDEASAAKCVDEFALFFRVQDLTGWLWEQTDDVANTVFLNNQSAMPMAAVRFGPAALLGFHPWHSHQHVHIVAAPADPPNQKRVGAAAARLAGGVDIYLPKSYSPLLGSEAFKARLLRGWQSKA